MSQKNTDLIQHIPKIEVQPEDQSIIDSLYCEKCYDMINYFIDECYFLSKKSVKFERLSKKLKEGFLDYRHKLDNLQFDYDELKASKEVLEEELQLFRKKIPDPEISHVTQTTTVNDIKKTSKIILSLDDMKLDESENLENKKSKSITIDIDSFSKYFLNNHITLNKSHLQLMFDYLAKMIINRQKNSKIVLVNQTDTKSITYNSDFDIRKDDLLEADEHLKDELKKSRDLNQDLELKIKNLTESNEILTQTNFNLVQETTKLGCTLNENTELELKQIKEELQREKEQSIKVILENQNLKNEIQQIYETLEIQNQIIKNSENTGKLLVERDNEIVQLRTRMDQITKEHDDFIFFTDEKIKKLKSEISEKSENCFKIEQEMAQLREQYHSLFIDSEYKLATITEEYKNQIKSLSESKQSESNSHESEEISMDNLVKQIDDLRTKLDESEAEKALQKNEISKLSSLLDQEQSVTCSLNQKYQVLTTDYENLSNELKDENEQLRCKIENCQNESAQYKSELESALNKIIHLSTNNTELHHVVSEEEEMMINDKKTMENLNLEVAELKKCLETAKTEIQKLDNQNSKSGDECMDVDMEMETDEPLVMLNDTSPEIGILKQQICEMETEIFNLKSELNNSQEMNKKFNLEIDQMKQFFETTTAEIRSKHCEEIDLLNNKINDIESIKASLESDLNLEKNNLDIERQKLKDLELKYAENQTQIESLKSEKLTIENDRDQKSQNIDEVRLEIENLKATLGQEIEKNEQICIQHGELVQNLETQLEKSKQEIESLIEKINALENQKRGIELYLETLRNSHDLDKDNTKILEDQIQTLKQKYEDNICENEAKIANLENQSLDLIKSIELLKSEKAEKDSNLELLNEEVKALREKNDSLFNENELIKRQKEEETLVMNNNFAEWKQRYEQEKSEWEQKEKSTLTEIDQIKEANKNKIQEIESLNEQLASFNEKYEALICENEAKTTSNQEKIEAFSSQIESLSTDLNNSNNKLIESELILTNLKTELDSSLAAKSESETKMKEITQANELYKEELNHQINSLKTVKADLEQAHLRLENENMELRQDINRLRSDLQNLRETQDFGVTNSDILNTENEALRIKLEESRHKFESQANEDSNKIREFENQVKILNSKLEDVNREYEIYTNQTKSHIEQYEKNKLQLEQNLAENLSKIKDLEHQLSESNHSHTIYSQQTDLEITNLKCENEKLDNLLKEKTNIHENFVKESEAIIIELGQKYESLKKDNEEKFNQMVTEFESVISTLNSDTNTLQSKLNQYETQKAEMEALMEKLKEDENQKVAEMESKLKEFEKEVQLVRNEYESKITDYESKFCQEKSNFDQIVQQYDEKINSLNQKISNYEEIKSSLDSNLEQMQKNEVLNREKINQLQCELESLNQNHEIQFQEAKAMISNFESQIAQLNQFIDSIKEEKECLQSQIDALNQQIASDNNKYQAYDDQMQTKLIETKKAYDDLVCQNEEKIASMNQTIADYELALKNLNENLESSRQQNSEYAAEMEAKMRDIESQLEESKQINVNTIHEKESIIDTLNQDISKFKDQIGQLEAELERSKINADNLNGEVVAKLKEQEVKTEEIEAEYKSKVELLDKLNAEMVAKNEQLGKDLEKLKTESESKIDELTQLSEESEVRIQNLYQQLEELDQQINQASEENASLKEKVKQLNLECERTANERDLFIKTSNESFEDTNKRFKQKLDQSQQAIYSLQAENESLNAKLRDYDNIKSLEMAQLSKKFESNEMVLYSECDGLKEKCTEYEEKIKKLEIDIRIMDDEKSELRSQLIDYENQIDGLNQDFRLRFEREIEDLRQRSLEFELKYNDQLTQNKELKTQYESVYESLVSNELKFKEKLFNLNTELEKTLAQLNESKELLSKKDSQYAELVKTKEATGIEMVDLQRQFCDVLKEKGEMANSVIELTRQLSELKQQKSQEPSGSADPKNEEEIASLKNQVAKYSKERKAYKEEHSQNKKFKSQIEKQTKEIAKLEETIKEMQATNDFLTKQINNLNDHIYELSNKENENDSSENVTTPLSRKSLGRKSLGNKRLLEIQNESMAMNSTTPESNKVKHLTSESTNQSGQDTNELGEMTPSTARRLNQCAQQ